MSGLLPKTCSGGKAIAERRKPGARNKVRAETLIHNFGQNRGELQAAFAVLKSQCNQPDDGSDTALGGNHHDCRCS